jgi:hypothetical protein
MAEGTAEAVNGRAGKPKGGARPGAGRPKSLKTLTWEQLNGIDLPPGAMTKEQAREATRQMIIAALGPLLRSQIMHAQGIGHVYTRDKHGKFTRIEDLAEIDRLLAEGTENEHFFLFSKDPSSVAFKELLDRALDRPKEQAQEVHVTGEIELFSRLTAARQRVIDVTKTLDVPQLSDGAPEAPH